MIGREEQAIEFSKFQSPCGDYTLISRSVWSFSQWNLHNVSVPLRGLYPYKSAPYQWLNHAGSKPGFRGTTLRSLNFCDNFFHNVQETACLLMRGGFSVFWLLYAYSIPRKDGLIKAFVGIFFRKKSGYFHDFRVCEKSHLHFFFSLVLAYNAFTAKKSYLIL